MKTFLKELGKLMTMLVVILLVLVGAGKASAGETEQALPARSLFDAGVAAEKKINAERDNAISAWAVALEAAAKRKAELELQLHRQVLAAKAEAEVRVRAAAKLIEPEAARLVDAAAEYKAAEWRISSEIAKAVEKLSTTKEVLK